MDTDADDRDPMEKIDVRVPAAILEAIDEEYPKRGYASRSEAVRDALRDWLMPSPALSDDILDELEASRKQREHGETLSATEVRKKVDSESSTTRWGDSTSDSGETEYTFDDSNDELLDRLEELQGE